jgi:outer membrane lipoprotein carrier protein
MKFLPAIVLLSLAAPLTAQDAGSALRRAERTYHRMKTLQAGFNQTITNPMLGGPEESWGTLYLEPPSRFAMHFEEPAGDRIVADGTWLWAFTPSSVPDQVIKQPIPAEGATTPNLVAQFVDRPLERYHASYVGAELLGHQSVDVVKLVPRSEESPFREATIAIDQVSGLLHRMDIVEVSGQRRAIVFYRLKTDVRIPRSMLRFDVPDGVRVVTPF